MVVRIPHEATALFEKCRNKKTDSGYLFPILDETTENDKKLYENYRRGFTHIQPQASQNGNLHCCSPALISVRTPHDTPGQH